MRSSLPPLLLVALATVGLSRPAAADGEHRPVVREAQPAKIWRAPPRRVVHRVHRPRHHWVGHMAPGVVSHRGSVSYNTPAGMEVNYATDNLIRPIGREVVVLTAYPIDPPGAPYPAPVLTRGAPKHPLVRLEP
jgi:hypothetical protein